MADSGNVVPKDSDKVMRLWAIVDKLEARFDKLHETIPLDSEKIDPIARMSAQIGYYLQTLSAAEKTDKIAKEVEKIRAIVENVPVELLAKYNPEIYARQPRNNTKKD